MLKSVVNLAFIALTFLSSAYAYADTLQFSAPTYTQSENGGSVTITVTRVDGIGEATVDYASSDGTAVAGSDYTAASGTLTFAETDTSLTFTVEILDDSEYEGNETVNLTLSNPSVGATLGSQAEAVLTIDENDPVPPTGSLQFSASTYTVNENGTEALITVTRVNGSFGNVTVDYATSDDTAVSGSDYTATSGTLSFDDGVTSQTFSVNITNDSTYEGDETVDLALSSPSGGAGLGSPATAVLTIAEDDPTPSAGSLQFSASNYTVDENGSAVLITVTRVNGSFGTVTVDYASSDVTASAGTDYTAVIGTLTFADGDTSETFTIDVLNDAQYEGDETVDLILSDPTGNAGLGSPATAVLTIAEDDPTPSAGSLQFSASSYTVDENGATATITVDRVNGSFGTVTVDYSSSDGTAVAGGDYTAVGGTLSFGDGVTSETFTIPILNDAEYEGNETVNLALSNPTGNAGLGSPAGAVLTISEDDPVPPAGSLRFSTAAYSTTENGGTATITVDRVNGSFGSVTVDYASSDGSASAGADYTAVSGTLTFADGINSQTFTIDILNDTAYEGNETVNLALSNPGGGAGLGSPTTAVLTIIEDDAVPPTGSLQFSASTYTVAEDGITASITVTREGGSFGAASVNYATSDGSASAGSDYTAVSGTINFADGDAAAKTISVGINNDSTYEVDETVSLSLSNVSGATLGAPSSTTLTITDNDPIPPAGSLRFSAPSYTVAENGTTATITVDRVNGSFGTVSVDYATSNGTASAGSDYSAASGTLSFADGVTSQTFSVSITNDNTYEGDETVNLALSNPGGGAGLVSPATAVLTITEDDPEPPAGSLQFSAPSYTVAEDGATATITVTRVGGDFGTVTVEYASSDGTAVAGADYAAVSGTLTFADGDITETFTIAILDDTEYEGDETVNLTLRFPTGGSLGSPAEAVLTIDEDDPVPPAGSLQFSTAAYTESEDGGTATITVTRVNGSFGTVSVDYATSEGSASAGADYTAVSGTLSFADGVTSQTFTIDIFDDAEYEGDETVNLALSDPGGGAGLASPAEAVLTIAEDDPTPPAGSLQFSAPTYTVDENGAALLITVTRVNGSFGTVTVDYASNDVTASAGADYTAVIGTLSFADGDTSETFTIEILDDVQYEGDETLDLILRNPTGNAGLGSPASAVITIAEDEPVPPAGSLQFSAPTYTVAENGVTATITVSRVGGSFGTVAVDYATSDGTASAGADYTAAIGTLALADGVTSDTFTIDILDDSEYEGNETIDLNLSNPSGGAGLGSPASAVLTIAEDEPIPPAGSLQFGSPTYTEAEDGVTATITVTRVGGSFGTVTVDYASSDGTAVAGADYTAVIGTLTFADGSTSETFTIDVLEDVEFEGDETVNLSLSNPRGGAGLGAPASAELTIADAVPEGLAGSLQFSESTYRVAEFGVVATITVTRVGGSFGTVTVDYASKDGTATAGADYVAVNGRLSFANGETSRTFSVEIIEDINAQEGNESLELVLSNPTGEASLGSPSTVSLIITEKDAIFDGSGGGSIDLLLLMMLASLYLGGFARRMSLH